MLSVERHYAPEDAGAVLRAFRELLATAPRELCGLAGMQAGRGGRDFEGASTEVRELIAWLVFVGADLEEGERLAAPLALVAGPTAESARVMTYPEVQSLTSDTSGVRRRHYWKGSLVWDLSDAFLDTFVERGVLGDGSGGLEIFSLGGAISDVDDDDTAYPSRGAVFDSLSAATWEDPRDDDSNISTTRANWKHSASSYKAAST